MRTSRRKAAPLLAAALLLLGVSGCGPKLHAVRGKVSYADGTPVSEGMVVFEGRGPDNAVTARGEIQTDGGYRLGTYKPGDGALAGKYRVLVTPKSDPNAVDRPAAPPPFDARFMDFQSSGLEFEVTAAGPNDFPITVDRTGGRRSR
jgi:hypothetical protein